MRETLASLFQDALRSACDAGELSLAELPEPHLERPRDPSHGDWATNVAMQSAKAAKMNPRQIAETIAARIKDHADIESVEVAGPGFINIRLSAHALQRVLARGARERSRLRSKQHRSGTEVAGGVRLGQSGRTHACRARSVGGAR